MFNDKQLEAINTLKGNVRVIAGAGSGKTATLTQRYVNIIESGVSPANILCVTFTNKAANEMKERIEKNVGKLEVSYICTFHSFCLRILREGIEYLGYPKTFFILDSDDQKKLLKEVYKECNIDYSEVEYKTAFDIITERKIAEDSILDMVALDDTIKKKYNKVKQRYKKGDFTNKDDYAALVKDCIYYGYLFKEQCVKGLDFNDLILLAVKLLQENNNLLKKWQDKLEYIMVDEFQDASYRQFDLVKMLSAKHGNLFVVGDPDQTIYSWRGAKPEILVNFDKNMKDVKTIIMNQNYRSTPEILNIANKIISVNKLRVEKDLFTGNSNGDVVKHVHVSDMKQEGEWIARKIEELLKTYKPKDIAVLYRMHFLSRAVEENLVKRHIPYIIYSGVNFYERKEIKDVLAYLRLIVNPHDDLSFQRIINVPTRGIGKTKIEAIQTHADTFNYSMWDALNNIMLGWSGKAQKSATAFVNLIIKYHNKLKEDYDLIEFVKDVIEESGYADLIMNSFEKERHANVEELILSMEELLKEGPLKLDEYLQQVALITNDDRKIKKKCVSLMTIHSAKGLEFPVVFVCGLSEGYLPSNHADSDDCMEEERRLAYVAYTRAKQQLYLFDSEGFDFDHNERETSRFVTEVEDDLDSVVIKRPLPPIRVPWYLQGR